MTEPSPILRQSCQKSSQRINLSLHRKLHSTNDLGLWAPLCPITHARVVADGFGNIIRGIEVNGKREPASTELEDSVNTMFKNRSASDIAPGPMGVWAMINSAVDLDNAPDPARSLLGKPATRDEIEVMAQYLEQSYGSGGRLFQILSGGGGWGAKKGLLSIDPQRTHFALSEEEEMKRFFQTMDRSSFAPPGSQIQFFMPAPAPPQDTAASCSGIVFGVPRNDEYAEGEAEVAESGFLVDDHFGALSTQGVFISAYGYPTSASTAPHSTTKHIFSDDAGRILRMSRPPRRIYDGLEPTRSRLA
ncbi:hypothetical protein RJ55_01419 [Drechmeria coniospora]|nr:hypothetical protein RJ55_01419 [Drechmeria coniospora]